MTSCIDSAADAGGAVGPDVVAACALSAVPGIGAGALAQLAAAFGSLRAALEAGPQEIARRAAALGLKPEAREFLGREPDLVELGLWSLAAARAAGARVVLPGDPWFPAPLRAIERPPALLYLRGALDVGARRIAVVGSRDCDAHGLEIARRLGEGFARAGVQVVSGGARGVDAAAHAGALWGGGTTVAVLGTGIDVAYPPEHEELYARLASGGGAVVTELPVGTQPLRPNFPRRNRLVSGLSSAVVVVRAGLRSGALSTADHAARQKRLLFAVPGDATHPLSEGPNELLRLEVARSATRPADVLAALGWETPPELAPDLAPPRSDLPEGAGAGVRSPDPTTDVHLDAGALHVWRLLDPHTPRHADELATRARLAPEEALRKLSLLEILGMCLQRPGKYFLRREP